MKCLDTAIIVTNTGIAARQTMEPGMARYGSMVLTVLVLNRIYTNASIVTGDQYLARIPTLFVFVVPEKYAYCDAIAHWQFQLISLITKHMF